MHTLADIEAYIAGILADPQVNRLSPDDDEPAWGPPLIGVSDGDDPLYEEIRQDIGPFHWTPREIFSLAFPEQSVAPGGLSVIVWVLPQTRATRKDQRKETSLPPRRWAKNRRYGEEINHLIRTSLAAALTEMGVAARGVDISLSPPVVETAGRMVDAANLRALVRARASGTGREAAARHLVRAGGFELTGERLLRAERAGSLSDLIATVEGMRYHQYLVASPEAVQSGDAAALEAALDLCTLDATRAIASQYHLESGPLLRHLVALDYEARNMRAIAAGVAAGVTAEEIERVLIIEEAET